ncbi:3-hydroxyacyl-ACP dehydratase FabZ [candidate division WOR-3 bacterium]|nr:3-hydroxyacyl-ACP dehydratase FabZ [candidate division WOR-3 bacterium]MCK4527259.1 3-hydroxyacyl-ACP dehydratase FabZ [candidate division WOR-3 bacterium]
MPHRYPFLLIDRIESLDDNEVVGIKNVTYNEPFFMGHFPGEPIMPGVLIVESMVQTGGFLILKKLGDPKKKVVYFSAINKVRFRKPVRPGDVLKHKVQLTSFRSNFFKLKSKSFVEDTLVAEGEFTAVVADRKEI